MAKLSERQRLFVQAYALHGNATRAADEAGYRNAKQMGSRLTQVDQVKAELARLRSKAEKRVVLSLERKLELLMQIAEGTEGEDELSLSGDAVAVRPKIKDRIAAMALDSKLQGHLAPERHDVNVDLAITGMSADQLIKLAKGE